VTATSVELQGTYAPRFAAAFGGMARGVPRCFNHPGVGGALGLADPDHRLGFGYAMNRTGAALRRLAIERAVYAALA
jgi:CubicO group peptidase (beta-lactamase class C family)